MVTKISQTFNQCDINEHCTTCRGAVVTSTQVLASCEMLGCGSKVPAKDNKKIILQNYDLQRISRV